MMNARLAALLEGLTLALLACFIAAVAWLTVAAAVGLPPVAVLAVTVQGAFGSSFAWEQTLRAATPVLLTGLCVALPARAGLLVIGGEGAFVVAGLAAAVAAVLVPPALSLVALLVAGMLTGGLWLGLSGWLRARRGVHEAVAGLLLTYVAIALVNQLVEGPLRDPASFDKPATALISAAAQIGTIGSTAIHWGLPIGVLACIAAQLLIAHTPWGFALRVGGGNPRAAAFAGLRRDRHIIGICLLGGALAGLAAAFEIGAVHQRASASFVVLGYGYIGILVAALARGNMLALIPAAVLVGALEAGGGLLQRRLDAPAASAELMHGLLFIAVMVCAAYQGRLVQWWHARRNLAA